MLLEKLVKIVAGVVTHKKYVAFQKVAGRPYGDVGLG